MAGREETLMTQSMTDAQRMLFQSQLKTVRKDGTSGVLLALLLGTVGAHHFYLGRTGLGLLYLVFCWTLIPTLVGVVEAFLMPGRVAAYNSNRALDIAAKVRLLGPSPA